MVDYGRELNIATVHYTARADQDNGHVRDYEIYLSHDGQQWDQPVAKGQIRRNADDAFIQLSRPVNARYLKFVVISEQSGKPFATIAELEVFEPKTSH